MLGPGPSSRLSLPVRGAIVALLLLFLLQSLLFLSTTSYTYDETRYAAVGKHLVSSRPWTVEVATSRHPPLSFYLSGLGLVGVSVPEAVWQEPDAAVRGKQVVLSVGESIVVRSRLPMLLLGPVLGMTLFVWSRGCWGTGGGLLSLFLFAFSPNLIAHQSLITPDFAVTTFLFLAAWCFDQMCRRWRMRWALATGAAVGLALLSKFTALFLIPLSVLWMGTAVVTQGGHRWRRAAARMAVVWAVAGLVVLVGYQFQPLLFLKGIRYQLAVSQGEWAGYLLGEISREGWWYYFLLAVLVKVPVPAIVFALLAVVARFRRDRSLDVTTEVILLSTAGLFFVYLSAFNRLNIGLRYLLPAFPFALVWIGQAVQLIPTHDNFRAGSASDRSGEATNRAESASDRSGEATNRAGSASDRSRPGARFRSRLVSFFLAAKLPLGNGEQRAGALTGRLMTAVFAVLLLWQLVSVARVAPHYLAYFNEIAGGPAGGHRWLGDSNLDWGQDLKGLADYIKSHDLAPVCIRYFGTMPPELYGLKPCGDGPLEAAMIQAVSVSLLQGLYLDDPERFERLRDEEPIATIGYTIRLYRTQRAK